MTGGVPWERILTDATLRVQRRVAGIAAAGEASKALEVGASGDVTLLADKEAEEELFGALTRIKGLRIVSEEAGSWGDPGAKLVAVVDPLDGSSNYQRGIQFYCTSVAIAEGPSLSDVSRGLVRDLVTGDVYWAERGKGSFKNGRRLATSKVSDYQKAVVGVDLSRSTARFVAGLAPLVTSVARQVHFGANALELCLLAEGKLDAFIDLRGRMRATDLAAGYLIAKEAGAEITARDGSPIELPLRLDARVGFVASGNRRLHTKILQICG